MSTEQTPHTPATQHNTVVHRVSRAGYDLYCYATCSCRWRSGNEPTWRDAQGAANAHVDAMDASTEHDAEFLRSTAR